MKKLIIGLVVGLLIGLSATAIAAVGDTVQAVYSQFNYVVNGVAQPPSVTALVYDGTSFMRTTDIANMLGYDVTYKADTRTIEFNKPVSSPTPTPAAATSTLAPAGSPTPTPIGATPTPTPTPSGPTPTPAPTPVGQTPSPTPVATATPTSNPSATPAPSSTPTVAPSATPAPTASIAPTPTVTPAPTPYVQTNERMRFCNSLTDPAQRALYGCN